MTRPDQRHSRARDETPTGDQPDGRAIPRPDLRMVPMAGAAWAGAAAGTGGPGWLAAVAGLAAAGGVAVGLARRSARIAAVGVVLAACLAVGLLQAHRLGSGPVAALAESQAVAILDGRVASDPQVGGSGERRRYLVARVSALVVDGRGTRWRTRAPVLAVVTGDDAIRAWRGLVVGTPLTFTARLEPPRPGSDVAAVARVRAPPATTGAPSPPDAAVERVRAGLRAAVADRPAEPRALVPALVLGDTSAMPPELVDDFRSTGLTHLTAVSGANLTLLLAFVLLAARWCGVRGWWLRVTGLAGVVVFVALCRTEPSVLRAAAMGLVALVALSAGGRRRGLRHLGTAMLGLLLLDPFLSRSLGFALSVLASAGIVWWARRWADRLATWLPAPIADAVAVPLAAHLATLPVIAAIASQVSVSGVVTNALAGPLVGPATVLGFAAAGTSLVAPALAAVFGWGASWCAQGIIWIAHAGALLPGSAWRWPAEPAPLILLAGASLTIAALLPYVLGRWWLALPLATAMVGALLLGPVQPGWPPAGWILVACDVGQGDGLVARSGPGEAVVIDTGPDPPAMDRCLDQLHVRRVPLLVLSHFHADHVDGLAGVLSGRRVERIWVSPLASPPGEAAVVAATSAALPAPERTPAVGEQAQVGAVTLDVLGPVSVAGAGASTPADPESSVENDASLVIRLTTAGVRVLLTGDVEPEGQARLVAAGVDLRADVLKVPHHGSARQDPGFFAATGARVAVASAGEDNDYGHPSPKMLQLAGSLGMAVLRTDRQGSVAVTLRAGRLGAVTQR